MLRSLILSVLVILSSAIGGQATNYDGKLTYKPVEELPSFMTASDPNLDLSTDWLASASRDIDVPEQDIMAAVNRWNNELYPHNALAGQAYLMAVLMDPVTADITRQLEAAAKNGATAKEKIQKMCEWTMANMSHTQEHPKFADFPGNDPWGIQNVVPRPTYRKLLPSEMAAMKIHTGRISGKCMTLAHLLGGVFLQLGVDPADVLFMHMQMKNYTHGVALIRYENELVAVNNMAIVPAPFRGGTNPQPMELKLLYNFSMQTTFNVNMAAGIMDSTRLANSPTVLEGFLDDFGLPHSLADSRYPINCQLGNPEVIARCVMESARNSQMACLSKYAYQSLYVKHPGYYLTASLRTSPPRDLASQLEGITEVLTWIQDHIADGSIFPDGPSRLMTADQVLVFQQGSPKDKAVLAYTLLKHQGLSPAVVITETDGYIDLAGKRYSLTTMKPSEVSEKSVVFRLRAIEQFPGLAKARSKARDLIMKGDVDAGIEALKEAARIYPKSWQVHDDLSFAYSRLKQPVPAREHKEKANQLDPDQPTRLSWLAWMALKQQNPDTAIDYCLQGLAIEPENGYLKSNLIQGYIWTGRLDEAREYCRNNVYVKFNGKPFKQVVREDIDALAETNKMTGEVRGFAASLQE